MEQKKHKCGKAHHYIWEGDNPLGVCKYCGKTKKMVTFEEVYDKKSFSSKSGAGIHPIQHSEFSTRTVISRIINR